MVKGIKFPREDLIKFKTFNSITCIPSKLQEKVKELNLNINKLEIKIQQSRPIAMNAPCPCGSDRIFKRCCYKKEREVTYIIQESKTMSKLEYDKYIEQQKQIAIDRIQRLSHSSAPDGKVEKDIIVIPEHMKICPVCGEPPKLFAGPPWFEMICVSKHLWHICLKHNTIIIGPPNRKSTSCECQK